MPESDTNSFRRASGFVEAHKGKASAAAGGGFSLLLAYQLFVPSSQFQMLREDLRELNRDFRTLEAMHMKHAENGLTNAPFVVTTEP